MHDLQQDIINKFKKAVQEQKNILVNERLKELGLDGISFTRQEGEQESYWHEHNGVETRVMTFVGLEFETNFVGYSYENFNFTITMKYF